MKIQRGGIIIKDKSPEEAFDFFIQNSRRITFMHSTGKSIILRCHLDPQVKKDSPYLMLRPEDYKSPIDTILIKLCFVISGSTINLRQLITLNEMIQNYIKLNNIRSQGSEGSQGSEDSEGSEYGEDSEDGEGSEGSEGSKPSSIIKNMYSLTGHESAFINEVKIQRDIFLKTSDYLDPICPAPIYEKVYNTSESIINKLEQKSGQKTRYILNEIKLLFSNVFEKIKGMTGSKYNFGIGILAMEFSDGYDDLFYLYEKTERKQLREDELRKYESMSRLKIIELALKTGYIHGDYQSANFMINPYLTGYYEGINGRVMMIDFGFSNKIPQDKLNQIRQAYEKKKYMDCLNIIHDLGRFGSGEARNTLKEYPEYYNWVLHLYDNLKNIKIKNNSQQKINELNQQIGFLIDLEQVATEKRIAEFNENHKRFKGQGENGEDIYPELPLTEKVKEILFKGSNIIFGGVKKMKSKKWRTKINIYKTHKGGKKKYLKRKYRNKTVKKI